MKATAKRAGEERGCGPALEGPALLPTERTTAAAGSPLQGHLPSLPPPLCHRPPASFPDRRESSPQSQGRLRQGRLPLLGGREVRASRPLQRRAHRSKAKQPQRAHWAGTEGGSAWLEPGMGAEVGAVGQSEVRSAGARPSQAWGPVELRGAAAAGTADLGCTDGSRGGVCEPSQEKMLSQDTTESQNLPALHPHAASESSIPVTKRLKCGLRSVQPVSVCV